NAQIEKPLRRHILEPRPVKQCTNNPTGGLDRAENADIALGEFQVIGHVVVERRVEAGIEMIEKKEKPDDPKLALAESGHMTTKRRAQRRKVDGRFLVGDEKYRPAQDRQRRDRYDGSGDMQRRGRRQALSKLAAGDRGEHRGGVEPQPLLHEEYVALAE